ncbi:MAG TPA: hypothetical protein VMM76_00695 [Pirellulaceae bacterium]|nr:hypothetical protein [Pirellulaceae bacterium]
MLVARVAGILPRDAAQAIDGDADCQLIESKQVTPRVARFNQVGSRAFETAFTRWRVGLV